MFLWGHIYKGSGSMLILNRAGKELLSDSSLISGSPLLYLLNWQDRPYLLAMAVPVHLPAD